MEKNNTEKKDRIMLEHAKGAYEEACKRFGEEAKGTLRCLDLLAGTYGKLGEYEKALELHEKAYNLRCKTLGETHRESLESLHSMAHVYGELGQYEKASVLYEKAYNLRCKVLGKEHYDTLQTLSNLAIIYGNLGQYDKSYDHSYLVYLTCRKKHRKKYRYLKMATLSNMARICIKQRNKACALEWLEKFYKLQRRALGKRHPDTLSTLNTMARVCTNGPKSEKWYKKVYKLRCKVLGENHPDTLDTLHRLDKLYYPGRGYTKYDLFCLKHSQYPRYESDQIEAVVQTKDPVDGDPNL